MKTPQQLLDYGIKCHRTGDLESAEAAYHQILLLEPDNIHALNNLGAALQEKGNHLEAISYYELVLAMDPQSGSGYYNLGNAHRAADQLEEAIIFYEKAISLNPNYAEAYNNLGLCLHDTRRFEEAITVYRKTLSLRPDYAEVHNNLGNTLQQCGMLAESISCLKKAISLKKDYADARNNIGVALQRQGRLKEAIAEYRKAITLTYDYPDAHNNLSHALLLSGDLGDGFSEYEWRWRVKGINYEKPRSFKQPLWDGSVAAGKTIFLHAEQGYGDTIHFVRYASLVAERGARVIVECQPLLLRLLATIPGIHQVIPRGASVPNFDLHAPLLSLPRIFGTTLQSIPARIPYLAPPPSCRMNIDAPPKTRMMVGIAWAGSHSHANDRNRSCDAAFFNQLMDIPGISWHSLQKGAGESEIKRLVNSGNKLNDLAPILNDFADTAAAIDKMDLVITVDTAVAHLAGAMGKPVWVLVPFAPDWRWMTDRLDSPWYPAMLLFRQKTIGDWAEVFKQVHEALKDICSQEFQAQKREKISHIPLNWSGDRPSSLRVTPVHDRIMAQAAYIRSKDAERKRMVDESIHLLDMASKLDPSSVMYPFELGTLLQDTGRFTEALASYDHAIELRPDLAPIHNNKGNVLKLLGRFEEAAASYQEAARINPHSPEIFTNLGVALSDQRLLDKAESCYQKALALKADHASAHWNLSLLLLLKGDYKNGWKEYEWRWRISNYAQFFTRHKKPMWQGEPLTGRTILLHFEQGLGDTLQFIRYAPIVAGLAGRVIIQCQPELVRLLRLSGNFGEVIGSDAPVPPHDVQCSLMSLPYVLRTTFESIPADIPYIKPDNALAVEWGKRIGNTEGLKIGLVWAGKLWDNIPAAKSVDSRRSLSLGTLSQIFIIPNVTFYSLQLGEAAGQLHSSAVPDIIDMTEGIKDFADTAAIIANLDMVLCVDTSIAHLAGAMGKPVWVLSRLDGCWRWLLDREDSPWYPSLRLFRQTKTGDWGDVIGCIGKELREITGRLPL